MNRRTFSVPLAIATLLLSGMLWADEKKEAQLKGLDGVWKAEATTLGGRELTRGEIEGPSWTLNGGTVTFNDGKGNTRGHRISVDAGKDPHTIDFIYLEGPDKGKKSLGIYKFDGKDKVVLCWSEPGKDRPTKFESKPDSGILLQVLVRKKP